MDNSLFVRADPGLLVASEPVDDEPGWVRVDNRSLVENDLVTPPFRPIPSGGIAMTVRVGRAISRPQTFNDALAHDARPRAHRRAEGPPAEVVLRRPRARSFFDEITRLEEYYPTRAERAILDARADEIAAASGADTLIELGSAPRRRRASCSTHWRAPGSSAVSCRST